MIKKLTTNFTYVHPVLGWCPLADVRLHVLFQIWFLSECVAADVTFVWLDTSMDIHVTSYGLHGAIRVLTYVALFYFLGCRSSNRLSNSFFGS